MSHFSGETELIKPSKLLSQYGTINIEEQEQIQN